MVYKKYIKKNGKIYGPYNYQSKRVDGKVVSEYVGPKSKSHHLNKLYIFLTIAALAVIIFVFLFFTLRSNLSGNIVSDITDVFKGDNSQNQIVEDTTPSTTSEKTEIPKTLNDGTFQQTARNYKDWIIVTFKMGNYEIEYSYNNALSKDELNSLIEKDKSNWLNSISGK